MAEATFQEKTAPSHGFARHATGPGEWPFHGVVRVRRKETLCRPAVASLIMRGAAACGFKVPAEVMAELCRGAQAESRGIFIGFHESGPCVFAVGQLPTDYLTIAATVHMAYSDKAPRQIVAEVGKCLREWFLQHGHKEVLVINLLHSDRAFMRGLGHFGQGERAGGVIRFGF